MKELNESLLNYCYYSICFGEFVQESEKTNNRIKDKRESPDYYEIFATENKSASSLYKNQISTLIDNQNVNVDIKISKMKEKIDKVNSFIGINFNEKENKVKINKEKILYSLKNEEKNYGDLSVKYLFEQEKLYKEINSLKYQMKSMNKQKKKI